MYISWTLMAFWKWINLLEHAKPMLRGFNTLVTIHTTRKREDCGAHKSVSNDRMRIIQSPGRHWPKLVDSIALWTKCLCPHQIYTLKPKCPMWWYLAVGLWGGNQVMRAQPPCMGLVPSEGSKEIGTLLLCVPCEDISRGQASLNQEKNLHQDATKLTPSDHTSSLQT